MLWTLDQSCFTFRTSLYLNERYTVMVGIDQFFRLCPYLEIKKYDSISFDFRHFLRMEFRSCGVNVIEFRGGEMIMLHENVTPDYTFNSTFAD